MILLMNNFNNLVELFQTRCEQHPDNTLYYFSNTGLVQDNVVYTYLAFENKVKSIAALIQENTTPGDRVLLIFEPGIEYILTFWACLYAGVLAVPAYPPTNKNTVEKLQAIIENAQPKIILSNKSIIQNINRLGLLKSMSSNVLLSKLITTFAHDMSELLQWDFKQFLWIDINQAETIPSSQWQAGLIHSDDIAFLQYTSGSTAMPKGVMVTHRNLLANLELVYRTIGRVSEDKMVSWLPPYHDMGLIGSILFPVYCQIPIMIMSPLSFLRNPSLWLKAISDFRGTISGGPNFAYALCVKKINITESEKKELDLSQWRVAYNGSEPINHKIIMAFSEKFSAFGFKETAHQPIYGLAEATVYVSGGKTGPNITSIIVDKDELQLNKIIICDEKNINSKVLVSCGQPMLPLKIISRTSPQECQDGEIGEIWLSGECVTKGYWGNAGETEITYSGLLEGSIDNHYLKTGDLGFLLNGNLYVTGRIKDLIIIHGKNYYPQDIELVVEKSHPMIRLGCTAAFSITRDDSEVLAIVAELKQAFSTMQYKEVIKKIYNDVFSYHGLAINTITFIPPKTLPKTTSGKLRRNDTRKMLVNNELELFYVFNESVKLPQNKEENLNLCGLDNDKII